MDEQNTPQDPQQAEPQSAPPPPSAATSPAGKLVRPMRYNPESLQTLYKWFMVLAIICAALWITIIGVILAAPLMIAVVVFMAILVYKFWNQIQDGHQKTTPGIGVGFMFIPLFNLYWQFVAVLGLAQNLNSYGERHGIDFPRVSEGLALTWCILVLCTFLAVIPFLIFFVVVAILVVGVILFGQFKNASVAIAQHKSGPSQV